ncbi:hypothetical protein [Thermus scotoductus]|uniref:Uncharacterized protein n=1 Tax=Thermus scotoductus TaxID=37636 RepID=A0A430S0R1_THESC|nr:hypothetical protein [Thermus scotoductus]RTH16613.1 hypothetical protein CSW41_09250 [Thermus scotoductus]RTH27110.1 hypothetical protein CSW40_03660 [Thermus scotoductus]RTI40018.1 hypothetical protein CSW18_06040 [Thermus scotoductus]
MKRWLSLVLLLVVALLVVWAGYQGYARLRALEGQVAALESRVQAQEQALKALGDRVGKLEQEVFNAPSPPLSLPEVPKAPSAPAWPYAVGVVVAAVLLFFLLQLLRGNRGKEGAEGQGSSGQENLEASRMENEGAPPKKE